MFIISCFFQKAFWTANMRLPLACVTAITTVIIFIGKVLFFCAFVNTWGFMSLQLCPLDYLFNCLTGSSNIRFLSWALSSDLRPNKLLVASFATEAKACILSDHYKFYTQRGRKTTAGFTAPGAFLVTVL